MTEIHYIAMRNKFDNNTLATIATCYQQSHRKTIRTTIINKIIT